jgi:hypothetical protein
MQNGEGNHDLEDERRNLHGTIALPKRHLLKERLIAEVIAKERLIS